MKLYKTKNLMLATTLVCCLSDYTIVQGGQVTTVPDADSSNEIFIMKDDNVAFLAQDDNHDGTVTIDETLSTYANHSGTPSYTVADGSTLVDVTFNDDAAVGQDNYCWLFVTHCTPSIPNITDCTDNKAFMFDVVVPKVTFGSLAATVHDQPHIKNFGGSGGSTEYGMVGAADFSGSVTVAPTSAANHIDIKLTQYLYAYTDVPHTVNANQTKGPGEDTAMNYATSYTVAGDTLTMSGDPNDEPGPHDSLDDWGSVYPDTATFDANFNLYLQWLVKNSSDDWATVGKTTWSVDISETPTQTMFTQPPDGSVTPGTGSASTETPQAPSSY